MNLILSGPINSELEQAVVAISQPFCVGRFRDRRMVLQEVVHGREARHAVQALCESARVDHAFLEETALLSRLRLLAIDMDSTLINIECIDEIARFSGHESEIADITAAAMRGELGFSESLRCRVSMLKGVHIAVLHDVYNNRLKLDGGAAVLLRAAKQSNVYTVLVSGGFQFFTERLKRHLEFDEAHANELEVEDDRLTGRVTGLVFDGQAKARTVRDAQQRLGIRSSEVIVIGDGANDIEMMKTAEFSVAYHAKPVVRNAAKIAVDYGTLETVLDFFHPA